MIRKNKKGMLLGIAIAWTLLFIVIVIWLIK